MGSANSSVEHQARVMGTRMRRITRPYCDRGSLVRQFEGADIALADKAQQPSQVLRSIRVSHCALTLAARITLAHFSVSSTMSLRSSVGVIGMGTAPRSARRSFSF